MTEIKKIIRNVQLSAFIVGANSILFVVSILDSEFFIAGVAGFLILGNIIVCMTNARLLEAPE